MSAIIIHGRHVLLFDDDANAAFVNSREALVPFGGDDSCLIDRYDARHLLDRIPPRPVNRNQKYVEDTAGIDQAELDRERFLDLPLDENDDLREEGDYERGETERLEGKNSSSYQAVGFSYGNNEGSPDQKCSESNDSVFNPPFPVPTDLLNNLPPTEKLHQIMARTAIFVSEHGGQSEIVLRVKQGDNPTFGFLMPDNKLHPYFRFLVKHPQLLKPEGTLEKKISDNGGALSLLGSTYGTGEDDENANHEDLKADFKKLGKEEPPFEKEPIVQAVVTSKEKSMAPKKNHLIAPSSTSKKRDGTAAKDGKKTDVKPMILEPPTFLKRNIDKAVEFIQKNGRKFEAKLIEQDKAVGRFPFLLATNQYHPYYLKVLEEALEPKSSDPIIKRKSDKTARDDSVPDELVDDLPFNPHKKEKFTMLLGNTRREIVDQPSEPVHQSGVTADEAAMIVLAATRGRSPFPSTSTNDSEAKKPSLHNGKTSEVNSNEANLSEATMTKEQKIKAERLKRAKLFAATIKSGAQPITPASESKVGESNHASVTCTRNEPNHEELNVTEPKLEEFDEASAKERNYRKRNIEAEESDGGKHSKKKLQYEEKESKHHHRRSHRRHKHNHYSEDEDEDEHNKKHHRHHRRSHKKHSDSEDEDNYKETRHRHRSHRKYSDSEDEDKRKSSRHRSRHSKHDLSEDEDRDRSHKHKRKHQSPSEKEDLEEGELCDVTNAATVKSSVDTSTEVPSDLRAKIRAMLLETL